MKRAFFSEEYELFNNLVREHKFRLYYGNYIMVIINFQVIKMDVQNIMLKI